MTEQVSTGCYRLRVSPAQYILRNMNMNMTHNKKETLKTKAQKLFRIK